MFKWSSNLPFNNKKHQTLCFQPNTCFRNFQTTICLKKKHFANICIACWIYNNTYIGEGPHSLTSLILFIYTYLQCLFDIIMILYIYVYICMRSYLYTFICSYLYTFDIPIKYFYRTIYLYLLKCKCI